MAATTIQVWSVVRPGESVKQATPLCAAHSHRLQRMVDDPQQKAELAAHGEEAVLLTRETIATMSRNTRRQLSRCIACDKPQLWKAIIGKWRGAQ